MNEFISAYFVIIILIAIIIIALRIAWFFALFKIRDKAKSIEENQSCLYELIEKQNKATQKALKDLLEMQRMTNELLGVMIREQREFNGREPYLQEPRKDPDE